jgi:outer membrane protein assembly factor BamB
MTNLILSTLLLSAAAAAPEEWPCWRGPRLDGTSTETNLPLKWTATDNIAWKTPIPGVGHSSPIIHGDRVFLTSCLIKEQKRILLCLDRRDGRVLWQEEVAFSPLEPKHGLNSHASSTPATDGKHVWVSFLRLRLKSEGDGPPSKPREKPRVPSELVPEMVIASYTVDGKKVWESVPGRFYSPHGYCSSVIPYKDMLLINGDQDAEAYLVALDQATGKERWRVDRPNRTRSYCAPLIIQAAGKTQMVLTGSLCVTSYDPDTGKLLWIVNGPTEQYVASPVYANGLVFITTGFPEFHNMAIRPDGEGNVTKTHVAWHEHVNPRKASYVPSPAAFDRWFYVITDKGFLNCFEAKRGDRLYLEQLGNHHSGSPVVAGGHLYMTDDDGVTYVIKAGGTFDVVSRNPLGEKCFSSPAIARGQIFIRTQGHLVCIGAGPTR